ncbi:unnamed protein product [Brachionus calyciflorus]|uniref:Uncharacterized protein n=1 Tax=Brachionus calyciflorus TaxID=104777 RepID=A0A814R5K3_9BILA|nr:unnamed protein product [Brachionus calyciflorus]
MEKYRNFQNKLRNEREELEKLMDREKRELNKKQKCERDELKLRHETLKAELAQKHFEDKENRVVCKSKDEKPINQKRKSEGRVDGRKKFKINDLNLEQHSYDESEIDEHERIPEIRIIYTIDKDERSKLDKRKVSSKNNEKIKNDNVPYNRIGNLCEEKDSINYELTENDYDLLMNPFSEYNDYDVLMSPLTDELYELISS